MKCKCGKELIGKQIRHCSLSCKNKSNVADWRRNLKRRALEYKGTKCTKCGYNKCVAALTFHHLHGKDFSISDAGNTRSWIRVKNELDKCVVLCANCHAEEHSLVALM